MSTWRITIHRMLMIPTMFTLSSYWGEPIILAHLFLADGFTSEWAHLISVSCCSQWWSIDSKVYLFLFSYLQYSYEFNRMFISLNLNLPCSSKLFWTLFFQMYSNCLSDTSRFLVMLPAFCRFANSSLFLIFYDIVRSSKSSSVISWLEKVASPWMTINNR